MKYVLNGNYTAEWIEEVSDSYSLPDTFTNFEDAKEALIDQAKEEQALARAVILQVFDKDLMRRFVEVIGLSEIQCGFDFPNSSFYNDLYEYEEMAFLPAKAIKEKIENWISHQHRRLEDIQEKAA